MVIAPAQLISLTEFVTLPERKPTQEYIKGTIQHKPMPKGKHSLLQTLLTAKLNKVLSPLRERLAFCEWNTDGLANRPKKQTVLVYLPKEQVRLIDELSRFIAIPTFTKNFQMGVCNFWGGLLN